MAKMTQATSASLINRDDTGVFVNVNYDCPHCHTPTGELILIGVSGLDTLDTGFETDQDCGICGKRVTIRVPASLY